MNSGHCSAGSGVEPVQADEGASKTAACMAGQASAGWRLPAARAGVLSLLALALASAYLTRHCLAVANTTMQRELGFDNQQFGYLYGAFSAGYLLFQVPGGWIGQRFGTRVAMPLLGVCWSAATLATAAATSLPALVAARFALGLAQAGLIPNQAKVVNDWFDEKSRGLTSSVIVISMSLGSVASLWLTSWLLEFYDWRSVLAAYAVVGVVWAALFFALFRNRPSDLGWFQDPARASEAQRPRDDTAPSGGVLLRMLASGNIWALAGQLFFKTAAYNFLVTFFPAFLELAYGAPRDVAGSLASWPLAALVAGALVGGPLVDYLQRRTGSRRISRSGVAAGSLLIASLCMFTATVAASDQQAAAAMAVSAFFAGIAMPCPWAAAVDIGGRNSAVVMGYINIGSCLAGILITPAVGQLMDHIHQAGGDWSQVIFIHGVFYVLSALCWLAVNPDVKIDPTEAGHAV